MNSVVDTTKKSKKFLLSPAFLGAVIASLDKVLQPMVQK